MTLSQILTSPLSLVVAVPGMQQVGHIDDPSLTEEHCTTTKQCTSFGLPESPDWCKQQLVYSQEKRQPSRATALSP
jgi:hypothetical protein